MIHDRMLTITTGSNRKALQWNAETILWSALIERLKTPHRSTETVAEYLALPKSKQDDLKDVGGFVAGTISGKRRKKGAVTGRDAVVLDFDNIPPNGTGEVLRRISGLGVGCCVYSTRKHRPEAPRLRAVIPLDRTCTADEYEPIARKIAEFIGMELLDPTTFEAVRMMYWPSCCADGQYVFAAEDKPFASADGILNLYGNWRDMTEWAGVTEPKAPRAGKQSDPAQKTGIVGAFCRVYDVPGAIAKFLPDKYTDAGEGRYTYTGGSTTGGAVLYDNGKFLFSHHATDPASGKLCNAFDLVRLHLFGEKDDDAKPDTPTNRMPSFEEMCRLAASDEAVLSVMNAERYSAAVDAFSQQTGTAQAETPDTDWMKLLKTHPETGMPLKTIDNILIILEHDPMLSGRVRFDEFSNRILVTGGVPWNPAQGRREWNDTDDAGLRHYMERVYGITGKEKILDGFALCCDKHRYNAVGQYLGGLPEWDGVPRLETLFIDYLGAADTPYVRAATRKAFAAAVSRALRPGIKYDTMPILAGPQGLGKSTLLRLMGRDWFNDSLNCFEGKDACEMIQGSWLIEIQELNGMNRAEENQVKQFLSKTDDIFREPYGRRTGRHPRRCVFFGTTNESEFLRDKTGGRRFWPIDCAVQPVRKDVFRDLESEVDQIWAEALSVWRRKEPLHLDTKEIADAALQMQEAHAVHSPKEGVIRDFLAREVPEDWDSRSLADRRLYWSGTFQDMAIPTKPRTKVCALEIWCELFSGEARYFKQTDAREINAIIEKTPGWKRVGTIKAGIAYGIQRGYVKR